MIIPSNQHETVPSINTVHLFPNLLLDMIDWKLCFSWTYQTSEELDGSSHWGLLSTYGGGGSVQNLASNKKASVEIIESLKGNLWLDRGTRAVFIDFTVYNANINLFCVVRYCLNGRSQYYWISSPTLLGV